MQAGRMKERLELLRPERTTGGFGDEAVSYTPVATVHAERVKYTARRSEEAAEHFADYYAEFNIRDAHAVADGWRARQVGGELYTVVSVLHNRDRGMKTLICERVNE